MTPKCLAIYNITLLIKITTDYSASNKILGIKLQKYNTLIKRLSIKYLLNCFKFNKLNKSNTKITNEI